MKVPTQTRAKSTVAQILDAAEALFDDPGFDATTARALAERAGLSVGGLYEWFPNKTAVAEAVAQRHIDTLGGELLAAIEKQAQAPWQSLVASTLTAALDAHLKYPRMHRFLFENAPRSPAVRATLAALEARLEAFLAERLTAEGIDEVEARHRAAIALRGANALLHEYVLDDSLPGDAAARLDRTIMATIRLATSEETPA